MAIDPDLERRSRNQVTRVVCYRHPFFDKLMNEDRLMGYSHLVSEPQAPTVKFVAVFVLGDERSLL